MRNILKSFLVINILFMLLVLVNLIPRDAIYKNLCNSVDYYKEVGTTSKLGACTSNDISADSNELNILYSVDSSKPMYSALIAPFYRIFDTQEFPKMAEDLIYNKLEPNYNYNRYIM